MRFLDIRSDNQAHYYNGVLALTTILTAKRKVRSITLAYAEVIARQGAGVALAQWVDAVGICGRYCEVALIAIPSDFGSEGWGFKSLRAR
jgi:hypothetical protein